MPVIIDGTNGITQADQFNSDSTFGFKNRIINGAMTIDQRNAGASVAMGTGGDYFLTDRFQSSASQNSKITAQQNAGSVTPPVGFSNYLGFTSQSAYAITSSDYFFFKQNIEGFNFSDCGFGTASAKTITLSFQIYSSLTGTFGGALRNSAGNRVYPFSYAISTANTWTSISITIAGDTTGTWIGATNGNGVSVVFGLGVGSTLSGTAGAWGTSGYSATGATSVVGTNGATFYITGVQLEVGSTATSFDYRPFGTELILAQRYFETTYPIGTAVGTASSDASAPVAYSMGDSSAVTQQIIWMYKVKKRSAPDVTVYNPSTGASGSARYAASLNINFTAAGSRVDQATFGSATVGMAINNTFSYYLTASSEL